MTPERDNFFLKKKYENPGPKGTLKVHKRNILIYNTLLIHCQVKYR
mgnify:CR=1 FL=1